jgi:hypothetical protein
MSDMAEFWIFAAVVIAFLVCDVILTSRSTKASDKEPLKADPFRPLPQSRWSLLILGVAPFKFRGPNRLEGRSWEYRKPTRLMNICIMPSTA